MFPTELPIIHTDELFRCEEQTKMADRGKDLNPIQDNDLAIKEAIYQALWKDSVLRAIDYYEIDVHVKDEFVYLYGHIIGTGSQLRILNAIGKIPGRLAIKNHLVLDDKLTLEVAASLAELEHTYGCKFFTGASHGVVSLNGTVNDQNIKSLAEKCAASNPNVRGVTNNVLVLGEESEAQNQPVLQPAMGKPIYFRDGVSGVVKQVIMNPNNRCVTAMTLQGNFSEPRNGLRSLSDGKAMSLDELIVVPMNTVRYLTKVSGSLYIESNEKDQFQDFNPLYFTSPPLDWIPPYPYCPKDVLFNVDTVYADDQIMVDPDIVQLNISAQPTTPRKAATPDDVIDNWEDEGGQIIETEEAAS